MEPTLAGSSMHATNLQHLKPLSKRAGHDQSRPHFHNSQTLECNTGTPSYSWTSFVNEGEERRHVATGNGPGFAHDVDDFLTGKWLLLVGDSAMRMLYHHLLALLSGRWRVWPPSISAHLEAGSCFDSNLRCPWAAVTCPCLEDAYFNGTRLTMVWTKYGHSDDLKPVEALANQVVGRPDIVLMGISAWWANKASWKALGWAGSHSAQYSYAVRNAMWYVKQAFEYRRIQPLPDPRAALYANESFLVRQNREQQFLYSTNVSSTAPIQNSIQQSTQSNMPNIPSRPAHYFPRLWHSPPHFVFMSIPNCNELAPHKTAKRIDSLNKIARGIAHDANWSWFDRFQITRRVCRMPKTRTASETKVIDGARLDAADDCIFGYPHPIGRTLNIYTHVLMQMIRLGEL